MTRSLAALLVLSAVLLAALPTAPPAPAQAEPDCTGPAGDPAPGSAEWDRREDDNAYCATQRNADTAANPAYQAALLEPPRSPSRSASGMDPFREPELWNGSRFRFEEVSFSDASGASVPGLLFRPCDASCRERPAGLRGHDPPYPGVVVVHGGAASQEMYLWAAEGLAEAGYMVLTFSIGRTDDTHYEVARSALDYLTSTPTGRAGGRLVNPRWAELDRGRIGLAGHSAGGVAVSRLGQEDPRVSALVSWDRAQSGPMPADLRLRTPALFLTADFNCQRVPVCLPERYPSPPDPHGPGSKDEDFQRVRAAGVETMKVSLRAATHLDFTEFPQANGSRHGVATAFYYTLAWLDRHLMGAEPGGTDLRRDALRRLVATRFDDSGDVHNLSGGRFDASSGRNVPPRIAGQPVPDRLSFHFRSAYFLDGGRRRCEDMRAGCPPPAGRPARPRLLLRVRYRGASCARRRVMVATVVGADAGAVASLVLRYRGGTVARGRRSAAVRLSRLRRSGELTATATLRDGRTRTFARRLTLCSRRR
ncbi:MAG TPA: hypothetical protein VF520_08460 [Thermoleophilaceae bacterium]